MIALVFRRGGWESGPAFSISILRFATLGGAALSHTFARPTPEFQPLGFGANIGLGESL